MGNTIGGAWVGDATDCRNCYVQLITSGGSQCHAVEPLAGGVNGCTDVPDPDCTDAWIAWFARLFLGAKEQSV